VLGWGWISYWSPSVRPFRGLAVIDGVEYLQAHNAWLDVWMQLGFAGLVLFAVVVVVALARSLRLAFEVTSSPRLGPRPGVWLRALPLLLLTALLVQSVAESRLLIEYGILLLALISLAVRPPPHARPPHQLTEGAAPTSAR
jgi:exopolysaccharide production protein ExoQ